MTDDIYLKILNRYERMLTEKGIKAVNSADQFRPSNSLAHAKWMVQTLKRTKYSTDKLNRWIGFIQCCLILGGLTTIDDERDITREWIKAI